MDARAQAADLVDQLARDIELPGLAFDADGVIELALDDGTTLCLGIDPDGAILLFGPLGGPTAGLSRATLVRLLATGGDGPMVVLDDANDTLCLQDRLDLEGLAYPAFKARLEAFMAAQDAWRAELADELGGTVAGAGGFRDGIAGPSGDYLIRG